MARAPFKLKSGNASTFKNLGSSPVKQDYSSSSPKYTSPVDHPDGPAGDNKPKLAPKIDVTKKNEAEKQLVTNKKTNKRPIMPKDHPVTLPKKNRVDNVKGNTKFRSDIIKIKSRNLKEMVKNKVKKTYDYFTKK